MIDENFASASGGILIKRILILFGIGALVGVAIGYGLSLIL